MGRGVFRLGLGLNIAVEDISDLEDWKASLMMAWFRGLQNDNHQAAIT